MQFVEEEFVERDARVCRVGVHHGVLILFDRHQPERIPLPDMPISIGPGVYRCASLTRTTPSLELVPIPEGTLL